MKQLIDVIHQSGLDNWQSRNELAFKELFASNSRYTERAKEKVTLRAPLIQGEKNVSFAAYIHPDNPDSGAYGGMSFVIFPIEKGPCLVALVIGTQGLSPDEEILARPGHARKVKAICSWLNKKHGKGKIVAWAKQDPVRIDSNVPDIVKEQFSAYSAVFERYGNVLYGIFAPNNNKDATIDATTAFLDLMFEERGQYPRAAFKTDSAHLRSQYFSFLMPDTSEEYVLDLLNKRRFVILEGPPGTGKTRMALRILNRAYKGKGFAVQFHPNITYENFVGGLAPLQTADAVGFKFAAQKGFLMKAAEEASKNTSKSYLLLIDEINRADLSKILGEAIYLLEANSEEERELELPYDFGEPFFNKLKLPNNLHILGTMNSADRSIAIVDVAVRRRFAFVKLWPQLKVLEETKAAEIMYTAFEKIISIFVEYAGDESFNLVPGHSYFIEKDQATAIQYLKVNLIPLLEEYLAQGYVASFSEPIRAYVQWIEGL